MPDIQGAVGGWIDAAGQAANEHVRPQLEKYVNDIIYQANERGMLTKVVNDALRARANEDSPIIIPITLGRLKLGFHWPGAKADGVEEDVVGEIHSLEVKNVNLNPNSLAAMATNQGPLRLSLEMPRMEFSTAEQLRMRVMYGLCCGPQCFPAASAGLFTTKLEDIKVECEWRPFGGDGEAPNDLNLKFTQMHVQGVENQFRVLGCITPACMGCFFPVQLSAQSLLGFGKGDTFSIPNPIEWAPESFPLPKL